MQVPETPKSVHDLDLMKQLERYATGVASWDPETAVGPNAQNACKLLHANVVAIVEKAIAPILDRVTAKEMDTFTMHDRSHGLKVSHLMWHILEPSRRQRLTPPEIALLVLSAHFHDIGMALTKEERNERLSPTSDLWERLEVDERTKERIETLRGACKNTDQTISRNAQLELTQIEESLLSQDTRERHATRERYEQVFATLREFHANDPESIPGVEESLSFNGDSFREKLIETCVSHNEDAEALVRRDTQNPARPRFPTDFPIGACTADLHMVAAALRLADILDFDRERTPPALFYYLIPGDLPADENRSVLEWGKHMSISHWDIDKEAIVFRGRCKDHIIHHAVVLFCATIQQEVQATRATFGALKEQPLWPFTVPQVVESQIHEEGYHYVPYRFELDDQRIYSLLMGGAIYDNSLVAVRELVQNAVDACKLRDALTQLYEPYTPVTENRIFILYEEPNQNHPLPLLTVSDTGTGMDAFILERYFLKIGQSYYNSQEFNKHRVDLRKNDLDFAPISEFGIGFLSCFLLADRVEVETAMWESPRGDTRKRTLLIDGPTRLIRLNEQPNEGSKRLKGTRVSLHLRQRLGPNKIPFPQWKEIQDYLLEVCREIPYRIRLSHCSPAGTAEQHIDPNPLSIEVPRHLELAVLRISVNDPESGIEGEIGLTNYPKARELEHQQFRNTPIALASDSEIESERRARYSVDSSDSELRRGGFRIGEVPGLPRSFLDILMARAKVRLTWQSTKLRRYLSPNLARNGVANERALGQAIFRIWLTYFLQHSNALPEGQFNGLHTPWVVRLREARWLETHSAYDLYRLARHGWTYELKGTPWQSKVEQWERGELEVIWLGKHDDVSKDLLEMILPRISGLILGPNGHRYVSRPTTDWERVLQAWSKFVTHPIEWGTFAEYTKEIDHLLFYGYPGYESFNSKFRDRIEEMGSENLKTLATVLYQVTGDRDERRTSKLSQADVEVLTKAIKLAGELRVGSYRGSWPLRDFAPSAEA